MENRGQCPHCGGELYGGAEDQWWECADCGCAFTLSGQLMRRGAECTAPEERPAGVLAPGFTHLPVAD